MSRVTDTTRHLPKPAMDRLIDLIRHHQRELPGLILPDVVEALSSSDISLLINPVVVNDLVHPVVIHSSLHQLCYRRLNQVLTTFFSHRTTSQYNFYVSSHNRRYPIFLFDAEKDGFVHMYFSWIEKIVILSLVLVHGEHDRLLNTPRRFSDSTTGERLPPHLVSFMAKSRLTVLTGSPITMSSSGWSTKVMQRLHPLWSSVLDVAELVDRFEWNAKDEGRESIMEVGEVETTWITHRKLARCQEDTQLVNVLVFIALFYLFSIGRGNGVKESSLIGYLRLLLTHSEVFHSPGTLKAFLQPLSVNDPKVAEVWFHQLQRLKVKMADAAVLKIGKLELQFPRDFRPVVRHLTLMEPLDPWRLMKSRIEVIPYAMVPQTKTTMTDRLLQAQEYAILSSDDFNADRVGYYLIQNGGPGARILQSYWAGRLFHAYDLQDGTTLVIRSPADMHRSMMKSLAEYIYQQQTVKSLGHARIFVSCRVQWVTTLLGLLPCHNPNQSGFFYEFLLFLRTIITGKTSSPDAAEKTILLQHSLLIVKVMKRCHAFKSDLRLSDANLGLALRVLIFVVFANYSIARQHLSILDDQRSLQYHSGTQVLGYRADSPKGVHLLHSSLFTSTEKHRNLAFSPYKEDPLSRLARFADTDGAPMEKQRLGLAILLFHLGTFQLEYDGLGNDADVYISSWLSGDACSTPLPLPSLRRMDVNTDKSQFDKSVTPVLEMCILAFGCQEFSPWILDVLSNPFRALPVGVHVQGWHHSIWETVILPRALPTDDLIHPIIASLAEGVSGKTELPTLPGLKECLDQSLSAHYDIDNDLDPHRAKQNKRKPTSTESVAPQKKPVPLSRIEQSYDSFRREYDDSAQVIPNYSPTSPVYNPHDPSDYPD